MRRSYGNFIGYYFGGEILYIIGGAIFGFLFLLFAICIYWWFILICLAIWGIVWLIRRHIAARSAAGGTVARPQNSGPPAQEIEYEKELTQAAVETEMETEMETETIEELCSVLRAVADRKMAVESARRADRTS